MWIFILLMWRIAGKLLRRVGWGWLLVPVAAMGMALAGVHFWTVALVLIALAVVLRKPLLAAALLPLSMVSAGLAGLVVAATTPGGSMNYFVKAVMSKPGVAWTALPQVVAGSFPAKGVEITWVAPAAAAWAKGTPVRKEVMAQAPGVRYWMVRPGMFRHPLGLTWVQAPGKPPAPQAWSVASVSPSLGWWQGRLLVPVALILLTIGLWLAPRMLRGLRPMAAARMPELRQWLAANRWALLLPPVVGIGRRAQARTDGPGYQPGAKGKERAGLRPGGDGRLRPVDQDQAVEHGVLVEPWRRRLPARRDQVPDGGERGQRERNQVSGDHRPPDHDHE